MVKGGTRAGRPTPRRAALVDLQRRAIDLRLAGNTFDQIAEALGYADRSVAYRAVQRALVETQRPGTDELREVESMRLDQLLHAVWPAAIHGDLKAVDRVLRILDQRAKLLGLNLPVKVDVTATVEDRTDPETIELVQRIRAWSEARTRPVAELEAGDQP